MDSRYNLIASFVHGNSLGVVLEPRHVIQVLNEKELKETWKVCIGPLVPEAVEDEYPQENYDLVVQDLLAFCKKHGIERGIGSDRRKK